MSKLFTIPNTAERLGVSQGMVWRMLAAGQLRALKIGRATRVHSDEIERLISSLPQAEYRSSHEAA
jgi:excisionase family DNA binding protein